MMMITNEKGKTWLLNTHGLMPKNFWLTPLTPSHEAKNALILNMI